MLLYYNMRLKITYFEKILFTRLVIFPNFKVLLSVDSTQFIQKWNIKLKKRLTSIRFPEACDVVWKFELDPT